MIKYHICKCFLTIKIVDSDLKFAIMKIKVGELVKNQVNKSDQPRTKIAQKSGMSRNWLNHILENEEMDVKHIVAIGKAIKYDFSKDLPQLKYSFDDVTEYDSTSLAECQQKVGELTSKYLNLLEKYTALVEKGSLA